MRVVSSFKKSDQEGKRRSFGGYAELDTFYWQQNISDFCKNSCLFQNKIIFMALG